MDSLVNENWIFLLFFYLVEPLSNARDWCKMNGFTRKSINVNLSMSIEKLKTETDTRKEKKNDFIYLHTYDDMHTRRLTHSASDRKNK